MNTNPHTEAKEVEFIETIRIEKKHKMDSGFEAAHIGIGTAASLITLLVFIIIIVIMYIRYTITI